MPTVMCGTLIHLQSRTLDVRARNWFDEHFCCQVHHFVDVTYIPLVLSSHTSSEHRSLGLFTPGHRPVPCWGRGGSPLGLSVCLPRLPQLNVAHEGKCWGRGQWPSGLMGVPTPQTHSAQYCFFGGRTHPAATLPLPVSSCAVPSCPQPCFSLCAPSAPCPLCHPLAPASFCPGFIISSCLSLLLLWGFGSPDSIIAHHPALDCSDHIKSIPGLDWVGPRWAIAMFYFGPGPAGGNTNLLDTSTPSRSIDPPAPTHDNSPSR